MSAPEKKSERLLLYLETDEGDGFAPGAFFLHFGGGYQSGTAAIEKHQEFFRATDMDFVKIQFEVGFPAFEATSPADYDSIPVFPNSLFENQLAVVKGLVDALKPEALVVLTLYSPFMITSGMVGRETLIRHMEEDPERVATGIEIVSDGLMKFVRECIRVGVDGFYHSTQGGESKRFKDRSLFLNYVKPSDLRVMKEIDEACPFSILHICDYHQEFGFYDDLTPFLDYPGTVVNVSTEIGGRSWSPSELASFFDRPFMGGLSRLGLLATGTPEEAREAARPVLVNRPAKFILGADCTVPGNTPWSNLRAAIDEAHGAGS